MSDTDAIIAELRERIDAFGGLTKFIKAHPDLDRRNVWKHTTTQLPKTDILMMYITYLGITRAEFFASVDERTL